MKLIFLFWIVSAIVSVIVGEWAEEQTKNKAETAATVVVRRSPDPLVTIPA